MNKLKTALFLLCLPMMLGAKNYYVATDGNDKNSGTKEKPFAKYSTVVSVDTNAVWLIKTVCKSIARVLAGKPVTKDELINISLKEALNRLNDKDLLLINESRRIYRVNEFLNLADLKEYVNSFIDLDKPISSAAMEVFYGEKFGKRNAY